MVAFELMLRHAAHEFLDEGRTRAVRALREFLAERGRNRQSSRIQRDEPVPVRGVGQGKFDRLIHAARATRERGLEHLGTVGGENEEHVGALAQAIELVEQLIEQYFIAGATHVVAIARDQVRVFDDDQRRLQEPRERHV
jgi:hypothetical protein